MGRSATRCSCSCCCCCWGGMRSGRRCTGDKLRALTIWQPWATLVMIGAKPFEFRRWDYRERQASLEGQRIVIHAGSRPVRLAEVEDIISRMEDRISSLRAEIAMPLLLRLRAAYKGQGVVELAAGLGTAILGKPKSVSAL